MTICPCCGFKLEGQLSQGCKACGASAVGEPLPKPDYELPSYARSLLLIATGGTMVLVFLAETVISLVKHVPFSFAFWSWVAAGETAAWRLKWAAIPVALFVVWFNRKIYSSMLQAPERFCGLRYASGGYVASVSVPLLIAMLIAITVPERLRQRQQGIEAAALAPARTFSRAFFEYEAKFGHLPTDVNDLRHIPDPDGSIAAALNILNPDQYPLAYKPSADVAALPKQKQHTLRGAVIRNASISQGPDESLGEGLSFTNYELRLPGPDKLMGTDDDLILRDGVILKVSEMPKRAGTSIVSTNPIEP